MTLEARGFNILLAEDDEDDALLIRDAVAEAGVAGTVRVVRDGAELLDYLRRSVAAETSADAPCPDLILLDLNMPRKTGLEALAEVRADPRLVHFPVVVLTTSRLTRDMQKSFDLGVTSFVVKPDSYSALVEIMRNLADYWLRIG
ncbi:MAG: response regulator [Deltaproteobacteria bacterium]|nr:response regulator [Deltaproteobacteria bacterium]